MLLIDGTNTLIRLRSAAHPSANLHLMFMRSLIKLCKQFDDWHVLVAWDISPSAYRLELHPSYKCYAYDHFEPYWWQQAKRGLLTELHERVLPCAGVTSVVVDNVEADDIIATACAHYHELDKVIVSTDRDYLQLISDKVSVYEPTKDELIDERVLMERYSAADVAMAAKLALVEKCVLGDISDNIAGIVGIGAAKVKRILEGYKTNQFHPEDYALLKDNQDKILFNRSLISLAVLPECYKGAILARLERAVSVAARLADDGDVVGEVVRMYGLEAVKDGMRRLRDWDGV